MATNRSSSVPRGRDLNGPHLIGKISGRSEMADLIRMHDWSDTELGALNTWPDNLINFLNAILASRFPMAIAWGPRMIQFYNDAYCPLFAEKHPGALGKPAAETWGEAWRIVGPELEAALVRGESTYHENVLIPVKRGGRVRDVYWTYSNSPLRSTSGEIEGILSISHDVTGEVAASRERDAFSNELRQVLEATTDAVVSVDREWRISYMNPRARELAAPEGEVIGCDLWEAFTRADYPGSPFRENMRRAMEDGVSSEFEGYYPEPLNLWIDVQIHPTSEGVVAFFRDMTAQRRAEQVMRETAARREAIYNTTLEYIGLLSAEGRLLDTNRASLEFAGNTREELVGKYFWECPWTAHTPGAPEALREAVKSAAAGEHIRHEVSLTRPSGEVMTFDFSLSPIRDSQGKIAFLVPEAHDISLIKRAELVLKDNEKLAAVGRLAASIAHEVNNPLEALTNLLYLALEAPDPRMVRRYLTDAERELRRVSVISNQTLRFYRQSTNPTSVHAEEMFESALAAQLGRILNGQIHVERRFRAKAALNCFEGEIRQVLNNLIGNAIDAMRGMGGGRLMVRSREGTHWQTGRKGLMLTVADTGHGIDRRHLEKIFEPFFSTKDIGGTGLGLWVSQEIVRRHLGLLRVYSSRRKGRTCTVFLLFLPFDGVTLAESV